MRPIGVVVFHEFVNQIFQMHFSQNEEMVQAFAFDGCHPALGIGVEVGGASGNFHDGDIFAFKEAIELPAKFNIAISDQNGLGRIMRKNVGKFCCLIVTVFFLIVSAAELRLYENRTMRRALPSKDC
jgi:hypothetical protein